MPRLALPTAGTRLAAWIFPGLTLWLGLGYFLGDLRRFSSPAFDSARDLMPMHAWGLVFIAVAVVQLVCLLYSSPRTFIAAMCLGMGLYAAWAVFFAASLSDPRTSWGAPAWPAAVVGFHVAFLATVARRGG